MYANRVDIGAEGGGWGMESGVSIVIALRGGYDKRGSEKREREGEYDSPIGQIAQTSALLLL